MRLLVFFYFLLILLPTNVVSDDINLALSQHSINDQITITVENQSHLPVTIKGLELILDKKIYVSKQTVDLSSGQKKKYGFTVRLPELAGSYAQQVNLYYLNDSKVFTLTDIGIFNYKEPFNLSTSDILYSHRNQSGLLVLESGNPIQWKIILPSEVTSTKLQSSTENIKRFRINGNYSGFNNNYPIFAVSEWIEDNRHSAQILKTTLTVGHGTVETYRGWTGNTLLLFIMCMSLIVFIVSLSRTQFKHRTTDYVLAYSSRLFWLATCYVLLKNSPAFFIASSEFLEQSFVTSSIATYWIEQCYWISEYLNGKNYTYFFKYFIDPYLWGFIVLYPLYLYSFGPGHADNDKYIRSLHWTITPLLKLLSVIRLSFREFSSASNDELQSPVKKGFLILAVKLFFLPLLASWVINNLIHQWNLSQNFEWTFHQINAFILALLILTDTAIFLAGYSFESYRAKNQIRSVEPTILGWVVCLWCYPPFNQYSFDIFDYQLFSIHASVAPWAEPLVLISITLLWGIFVWSSLTLGLKASNLTNRGTVSNGPYRYCRHPAYTAKVLIWAIEAVFLGKYFIGLLIGFAVIYFLRAWTEERHLAMDEEYLAYKQQVPYRFIPGVY